MKNKKVVYIHRKKTDNAIFYIGIGNEDRPYQKETYSRSVVWHRTVKKHGYYVEVIFKDLSWKEACEIEIYLIKQFGRRDKNKGNLVNLTNGGDIGGSEYLNLGKKCYNIDTGEIFNTIGEAAESIGAARTTINDLISTNKRSIKSADKLRRFDNPYPKNTVFWDEVRKHEVSVESDEFKNYDEDSLCYEDVEFDDEERFYLDKFYSLSETKQELIEESYYKSDRKIAECVGLNYGYVHKKRMEGVKEILGGDFYLYKNKRLKHKKIN